MNLSIAWSTKNHSCPPLRLSSTLLVPGYLLVASIFPCAFNKLSYTQLTSLIFSHPVSPIFLIIFVPPLTIPLKIALSHGQFITEPFKFLPGT